MTAEPLSDEALLARLVSFDTTSHKSNREIADFISDYLDLGIRFLPLPLPGWSRDRTAQTSDLGIAMRATSP